MHVLVLVFLLGRRTGRKCSQQSAINERPDLPCRHDCLLMFVNLQERFYRARQSKTPAAWPRVHSP
jgi:hypothetical protein